MKEVESKRGIERKIRQLDGALSYELTKRIGLGQS